MKITIFLLFLAFLSNTLYAQSKADKTFINKIENEILNNNTKKIVLMKLLAWNGSFVNTTVYLKNKLPILIETEENIIAHEYAVDPKDDGDTKVIAHAKFYIENWKTNSSVRIGKITYINVHAKELKIEMPIDYVFTYDKAEIEEAILKKK